jgi:hypothetical protein
MDAFCNRKWSEATMNKTECNNDVTNTCNNYLYWHGKTRKQDDFLKKCLRINLEEGRPFSFLDFVPEYTNGNFRQMIRKLKDKIVMLYRSPLGFYKIKGVILPGDKRRVICGGMRVNMTNLLKNLKEQPPTIHDLKLKFKSNLHEKLIQKGHPPIRKNKGILVVIPAFDENITAKAMIYRSTVQIDVGCTFKPFAYNIGGFTNIISVLGRILEHIDRQAGYLAQIPPVSEWIITHYHFGKDSTMGYSGKSFECTIKNFSKLYFRLYSKKMPDGNTIVRAEQIQTPGISLEQQIDTIIKQEILT